MKHIILTVLILTLTVSSVSAVRPKVEYQTTFLEVTDAERLDSCLRLSVILKNLPGYWVNLPPNRIFLRSHNDTASKYRLIGAENIELGKRTWMKESGRHEGTLIFEKVPSEVSVVDMLETEDNGKTETLAVGINLEEKDMKGTPTMLEVKTLFNSECKDKWEGLDPCRYRDIPYYKEHGKAHIKGRLYDYHPAAGYTTLKMHTNNFITGSRGTQTENLSPDGTFEFDLNVDYPRFCILEIGNLPPNEVFVIPGDTVELVTTTQTDFLNPRAGYRKYFGYAGKINDATAVNLLVDSVKSRYHNKEICIDKMSADMSAFLGRFPVNTYVKDLLATKALATILQGKELNEQPREIDELIYDNPLIISTDNCFFYILSRNKDKVCSGNSFIHQLMQAKDLIESIEVRTIHNRESLGKTKENVAELTSMIEYTALNNALLTAYADMVEDVVLEENSVKKESDYIKLDVGKDAYVLEELIRPYLGNLIYIDFWALWCAPCRQGMIDQKTTIENFAGQPFKVLYVSDDSNIAGSNQWLEKKEIPGEHIYLSRENWERISEYFNFRYIPFGVLIGKDGKLIKTHFNLDQANAEKEIERHLLH